MFSLQNIFHSMITLYVITGSTRPGRFNIQPTNWIYTLAKEQINTAVKLIDLATINLPFYNEPKTPKSKEYHYDYTKAWSKKIALADGFIFVTPEYNHSYSGVLKNAIDYLFYEWNNKPVSFVSYGATAGGARAVEHLRGVVGELGMYDIREHVILPNYWEHTNKDGVYQFTEAQQKDANTMIQTLVFWAKIMKDAREKGLKSEGLLS